MSNATKTFAGVSLFRGMSTAEILKLMSFAKELNADSRRPVISEGEQGDALYIVEKGAVIVSKDVGGGRHEVLAVLEAGEFFGEMALIDSSPRSASVIALEPARLFSIRYGDIARFLEESPESAAKLYRNFAVAMSERLRRATEKLGAVVSESASVKHAVDNMTSEILAVVSHELRTPVAVIQGAAEILEKAPLPPDKQEKFVANITKHSAHLSSLLDDIVQLADVQFHDVQIERTQCDIGHLMNDVVDELEEKAEARGIKIEMSILPGLHAVPIHHGKMRRVLIHLIDNGIKFNREKGRLIISTDVDDTPSPPQLTISIQDEGPGIPISKRDELFKCFRQGAATLDADRAPGMGIGLPLSRSLVMAHGGRLRVESPPEGGSVFSITIPME